MDGFLNLHKPVGISSHTAVARVRRLAPRGTRVGHAGTLDPAAAGVLPLALGRATRLIEYLADAHKAYLAHVRLGVTTTTDDAAGAVVEGNPPPPLDAATLAAALAPLRGAIMQVPPMYSALHHQGRRLYELAREGTTVERPPRPVTVYKLELHGWEQAPDGQTALVTLAIECSKGFYVRSLARDLGANLGCGAHLAALTRTAVGAFTLANAYDLAQLEAEPERLVAGLLPLETAVADWTAVTLDAEQARRAGNGMALQLPPATTDLLRAHDTQGRLLALLRREGDVWRPAKVFV